MKKNIVFKSNNPKQLQFIEAAFSGKYTVLLYGGAIRGGKTFVALAIAILLCKIYPGIRITIVRKDLKRLRDNTRPSLDKFISGSGWKIREPGEFFAPNGSKIIFKGENYDKDKTLESFKGHETNVIIGEEVSEIREETFNKFVERVGSYNIVPTPKNGQPKPMIIMTCNPTQSWVKKLIFDRWKNGTLPSNVCYIPAYITDNLENLSPEYVENLKTLNQYEYSVFVLGDWEVSLKAKNAFWYAFDPGKHIGFAEYDPYTPVHVSIDSNSLPYCTATFWQVYPEQKRIHQFHEICAASPDNHASGLARLCNSYLESIEYTDIIFIYGDATTKNQNTIDEKKRSFFDIFTEEIAAKFHFVDYVSRHNPQVAKTGQYVNALYENFDNWTILINETCKESINDYLQAKKAEDGTMSKAKIKDEDGNSFEQFGHISDTKRYFLYEATNETFHKWDNRFSEPSQSISIEIDSIF